MCYVLGRYSFIPVLHLEIILREDIHHEKKTYSVLRIVVQSSTTADYSGKKETKPHMPKFSDFHAFQRRNAEMISQNRASELGFEVESSLMMAFVLDDEGNRNKLPAKSGGVSATTLGLKKASDIGV